MTRWRVHSLCRRRGCCPEVAFAEDAGASYAAVIRETGGGGRPAAELRLTADELTALAGALEREGWVARARAAAP